MSKPHEKAKIRRCEYCEELFCTECEERLMYCSDDCEAEAEQLAKDAAFDQECENRAINR